MKRHFRLSQRCVPGRCCYMVSDKKPNAHMEVLKPPGPMNFKASDAADTWDKWAARFSNYFKAAELKKKDADVQVTILLELAGPAFLAIQKTFTFAEGDNVNDYELVLRKFTDYCRPR